MDEKTSPRDLHSWTGNLKSKIKNPKLAGFLRHRFVLAGGWAVAEAQQQPTKLYRDWLLVAPLSHPASEVFRETLLGLGYVEGQNIRSEWRFGGTGDASVFPAFAAELVRLKVDCIVTFGIPAIRAARQATSTIPIVMNVADDPVQMGLLETLARPGGNITGISTLGAELSGKRLELLKEAFPKIYRVAHLWIRPLGQGKPAGDRDSCARARAAD